MEVTATKTFLKQLKKAPKHIQQQVREVIEELSIATSLREINDCKKLQGYEKYFRIRIANYRLGVEQQKTNVLLLCLLERSQVYKVFPPDK